MIIKYENRKKTPLYSVNRSLVDGMHCHPEIEMVVCYSGSAIAYINSIEIPFGAGEFVIVFPNQIHGYSYQENSDFRVIIFPPDYLPYMKHYLCNTIFMRNKFSFNETDELAEIMNSLKKRLENDNMCEMTRLTGYLNFLFANIVSRFESANNSKSDSELLMKVLNYCVENYTEKISLESISQALFLTPSKISRLVNDQMGFGLPKYIANLRISDACIQLRNSGASIAEISNSVGIDNIRTFNRLFRELIGQSPTEYRNSSSTSASTKYE